MQRAVTRLSCKLKHSKNLNEPLNLVYFYLFQCSLEYNRYLKANVQLYAAQLIAVIQSDIHKRRSQELTSTPFLSLCYSWSTDRKGLSIYKCEHIYTQGKKKKNQVVAAQTPFSFLMAKKML